MDLWLHAKTCTALVQMSGSNSQNTFVLGCLSTFKSFGQPQLNVAEVQISNIVDSGKFLENRSPAKEEIFINVSPE